MPESDTVPETDRKCSGRFSGFGGDIQCQLQPGHGTAEVQPEFKFHLGRLPDGQQIVSWPKC